MDRYVVIGNPVSHSKSPLIHSQFALQTGQAVQYDALLAEQGKFPQCVTDFFAEGGKGANVTVPFKLEAFDLSEHLSKEAQRAGAVNTLYLNSRQELCGHNTDGLGLVTDLVDNYHGVLSGKRLLILGAGGATRGILQPLLDQQPKEICIANRTVAKAEALAEYFSRLSTLDEVSSKSTLSISGCGFSDLDSSPFDWIINATSASLQGEMPALPAGLVNADTWCYDLMYASGLTPFGVWAQAAGAAKVMDGLGMLVEQAAESFELWRGVRPKTQKVIAMLRKSAS